jgi:hypothetical protein
VLTDRVPVSERSSLLLDAGDELGISETRVLLYRMGHDELTT